MKNDNVFLLLNGEKPNSLPDLSKYEIICATDGAYQYLEKNNITPTFIAGDFDSIQTLPNEIEVINTPDQNYTDFDKILQILFDRGFYKVDVYGASGAEQDHFLGNLHTAIQWKSKLILTFYDYNSKYFLAKNNTKITGCKDQIVSLIPFPKATNILTEGLKYPLKNEDLIFGERIGTRNKAVNNEVTISFSEGNLFIFINH